MEKTRDARNTCAILLFAVAGTLLLANTVNVLFYEMFGLRALALSVASVCLPAAAGTVLFVRAHGDEAVRRRAVRTVLFALFGFYLAGLVGTLFLSRMHFATYAADRARYLQDWEMMTSFRPFETIGRYVRCLSRGVIPSISRLNIIGNVLLLSPMALFLPALFPKLGTFCRFLLMMVGLSLAIEALQLVLCCGSCDVDDVILNLAGALPAFGLLKIPPVRRLLTLWYILPVRETPAA